MDGFRLRPQGGVNPIRELRTSGLWLGAMSLCLLTLPVLVPLDGKAHADWQQFLGRFHPMAVHFPVALLLLVPVLEIAGRRRPALLEAAGFTLRLAMAACLVALTLGYLLAYGSGDSGTGVTRHMWGAVMLCVMAAAALLMRQLREAGGPGWPYTWSLILVVGVLTWTAHLGGSLTHGGNYLTQFIPVPLKALGGGSRALQSAGVSEAFYPRHVQPILESNCVSCHGQEKSNGGLALDSYESLTKGGKDGAVIVAGNPERSLLLQRITLPASHKLFMPAEGRPGLKAQEIGMIREWIKQGASPNVTVLKGVSVADRRSEDALEPVPDYSSRKAEIEAMAAAQGAKLLPVSSKPSDGLILATSDVAARFDDRQLESFRSFAPFIVEAELGRTAITDAGLSTLSTFTHLRSLHLEGTAINGSGLKDLAALKQLTYLNLSGTQVTLANVEPLRKRGELRLFLFHTPAEPDQPSGELTSSGGDQRISK